MQKRYRDDRIRYQELGKLKATPDNILFNTGCMLYWAEGSKKRNRCIFTNSDPDMMKLFVKFLLQCFDLVASDIKLEIHCYDDNGLGVDIIEKYWMDTLCLSRFNIGKTMLNVKPISAKSNKPKRVLLYGTARVVVNKVDIIQQIYGGIQKYAELQEPFGLDVNN